MHSKISLLIAKAEAGAPGAADELFSTLYDSLHRLACRELARHCAPCSLGVTTLLHEAYLGINGRAEDAPVFPSIGRFMGYASRVMRGLIIDHARSRRAQKRGGHFILTTLDTDVGDQICEPEELQRIGDALDELATVDPTLVEIVDLKFFCGFSFGEIAAMRGVSERTVQRSWEKARILLHRSVRAGGLD